MNKQVILRFSMALILALLINAILFIAMQWIVARQKTKNTVLDHVVLIDYVRSAELTKPTQQQNKRKLPKQPPPHSPPPKKHTVIKKISPAKPLPLPSITLSTPTLNLTLEAPFLGHVEKNKAIVKVKQISTPEGSPIRFIALESLVVIHRKAPRYPRRLKRKKIEGYVIVEFIVNKKGRVEAPAIIESNPQRIFDQSVLSVLKHWQFRPKSKAGKNIAVRTQQRFEFVLK